MSITKRDPAKLVPWSFSRLKDYEQCPFRAYEVHVNKNRGPQGPYMARGEQIHKMAEDYVMKCAGGGKPKVPEALAKYKGEFAAMLKRSRLVVQTELKFGLTIDWSPTDFFGRDVWLRGVWDLVLLDPAGVDVVDHKTGKVYPETTDQLRLYAASALAWQPMAPKARAQAWHLDMPPQTGLHTFDVSRKQSLSIIADFERRVRRMSADKQLPATPNAKCKWCHLRRSEGGPCPEDT